MSVFKRLSTIVQAKSNKALDRFEDPRETLDLSYEKQLEQLQQVRRGVADVATARKRIELQAQQLKAAADKLQSQARQAMAAGREDFARDALSRRASIATQLEGLKTQHDQLVAQEDKLVQTTQLLQARVEAFRTQKETLKASYTAAQAQTKIGEAVAGISESMSDTGMAMQRAQDRIANMQARAGAVDELLASGALTDLSGSSDPLQNELDKATRNNDVELELARMRGELPAAPAGQLAAAPAAAPAEPAAAQAPAPPPPAAVPAEPDQVVDGELLPPPVAPAAAPPAPQPASRGGDLFSLDEGERVVIVRILDKGQYEIDAAHAGKLEELDAALFAAIEAGDEAQFRKCLAAVVEMIHTNGEKVEHLKPSDLVVPAPDSTLEEVKALLASEEVGED